MDASFQALERFFKANGVPDPTPTLNLLTDLADEAGFTVEVYSGPMKNGEPREILDVNEISIVNYKGTAERTLALLPGTTLVYGANDSGKSSLIEGLAFALAGSQENADVMKAGSEVTRVTAKATGALITRQLDRSTKTRGANAGEVTIDQSLTVEIGGSKETRTRNAQGLITEWLGVPWPFISRAMLVAQGELAAILDEAPAKRREMFFQLLGLEGCDRTREALAKALRKKEAGLVGQTGTVDELTARLTRARDVRAKYDLARLQDEYRILEAAGVASEVLIKAKVEQLESIRKQLSDYEIGISRRSSFLDEVSRLQQHPCLAMEIKDLSVDIGATRRVHDEKQQIVSKLEAGLADCVTRGNRIKSLPPVCPTCLELGWQCGSNEEVKQKKLADLRGEWQQISVELAKERVGLDTLFETINSKSKRQIENTALTQEKVRILATISAKEKLLALLPMPDQDRHNLLTSNATVLVGEVQMLKAQQPAETAARRADVHRDISDAQKLDSEISWLTGELAKLDGAIDRKYIDRVRDLVDVFSKGGLPLWLAKGHVQTINNRALELAQGDRYTYQFNDDLAVEIIDSTSKARIPPSMASGSSRQRGALVLRATLGRYLQELGGIKVPLFWVDEIPFQDEMNASMIVDVIKRLTVWYPKVVLAVSQWEKYVGSFDHEIHVGPQDEIKTLQDLNSALADVTSGEKKAPRRRVTKTESDAAFEALSAPAPVPEVKDGGVLIDADLSTEPPF